MLKQNVSEISSPSADSKTLGIEILDSDEELWRDRYAFLKARGYILGPRYHPAWVPSWLGTDKLAYTCEDAIMIPEDKVIDAMQVKKNYRVSIKVVSRATDESQIASLLSVKELLNSPDNHCVPILDVFPDPLDSGNELLVMPYLRPFDNPPFEIVEEVVDFIKQTLEGLLFIHGKGVAHRDCSCMNIMMDGRPLFPEDHHPRHLHLTLDRRRTASYLSRSQCPVKYYYIDFGMSSYFGEGQPPLVLGSKGADQDAPELSQIHPYNAFMLDVFILGHTYEVKILQAYLDLDFLEPLVSAMTKAHRKDDRQQRLR